MFILVTIVFQLLCLNYALICGLNECSGVWWQKTRSHICNINVWMRRSNVDKKKDFFYNDASYDSLHFLDSPQRFLNLSNILAHLSQRIRVSFCDRFLCVVRLSNFYLKDISSKPVNGF